jgi:hypothetical protein
MAWTLQITGLPAACNTAINAVTSGNASVGEQSQIDLLKTYMLAMVAGAQQMDAAGYIDIRATGNATLNSATCSIVMQRVKVTGSGEVATGSPPTRLTGFPRP